MLWTTATLALKTVLQGETLLQPIGLTAKKVKSIDFGPINFKPNDSAITKCSYYPLVFSQANFSLRSAAIFCLSYLGIHLQFLRLRSHNYQAESKKGKWVQLTTWWNHALSSFSMIIRCHNRITIIEMILASLFSRHFHLFTSFLQQWRQKNVDSFERLKHGSPAPF